MCVVMCVFVFGLSGLIGVFLVVCFCCVGYDVMEWDVVMDCVYDLMDVVNVFGVCDVIELSDFVFFFVFDVGGVKYISIFIVSFIY